MRSKNSQSGSGDAGKSVNHPAPTLEEFRSSVRWASQRSEEQQGEDTADASLERILHHEDKPQEEVRPAGAALRVYSLADVEARRQALRRRDDSDAATRIRATLDAMRKRGGWRPLKTLDPKWRGQLDEIETWFPNCGPLIDLLRTQAALAERGDGALPRLAVLLDGPPGIGKTAIAEAIAPIIGGGFQRVPMAAAQSSGGLAGSDEFWSNSRPGHVFESLVHGEYANPVLQLDEIDKVSPDLPYNPLGALYDLLERSTASRFVDAALPSIPLDASRVLWLATSNQRRFVPRPILDRLTVIELREPTRAEMERIIASVDRSFHAAHPSLADMLLSKAAAQTLGCLPPRRVWKVLEAAYGRAAFRGSNTVNPEDLPPLNDSVPAIGFR